MSNDLFHFRGFTVQQHESLMKVHTDGVLLAIFSSEHQPQAKSFVEIGCGLGYVSLLLAKAGAKRILSIDNNPLAIQMTQLNIEQNALSSTIEARCISIQQWVNENTEKFDVIVSNPPYFENSYPSPYEAKQASRHDLDNWKHWFIKASMHLTEEGEIHLIYPFLASYKLETHFFGQDLFLHRYWIIHSLQKNPPILRVMAFGRKKCKNPLKKIITIRENEHNYTDEYLKLVEDYLFL